MQIIVEGKKIDIELPRENVQLKEVLEEAEAFLYSVGKLPSSLKIDGQELTQELLDAKENETLSGNETIEIGVITIFQFVSDSLAGASEANKSLIKGLEQLAMGLRNNSATNEQTASLSEVNHFFDFWFKLHGLMPEQFREISFQGRTTTELLDDFKGLLQETVSSMEKSDTIYAADLIEYELKPVIELVDSEIPKLKSYVDQLQEQENAETTSTP